MRNDSRESIAAATEERILTTEELAQFLKCSVKTLERMRQRKEGPKCFPFGTGIKYRLSRVLEWIESQEGAA